MPTTSTAITACDAVLRLDDSTGTLVEISGSTNKIDMNFDNKIGEFRTFGEDWMTRIQCGKDASFTIQGIATTTVDEIRDLIEDWFFAGYGARTLQVNLPSEAAGSNRYVAEVVLKTFSFSAESDSADPIMYSIELAPSGQVTRTTL